MEKVTKWELDSAWETVYSYQRQRLYYETELSNRWDDWTESQRDAQQKRIDEVEKKLASARERAEALSEAYWGKQGN